ncbi:NAD(P)H-hydrate dehydratase [Neokomagataea tanensis]|uniref:Bifunctional NAD(P)H-hydrate repair enzyme n=2 Tax=Neokomagataea TaxID=1223423 RepID=A0A4Y6V1W3_9PROT|nr:MULTISPECIES: NAD(P)H-hydrate dehydratase [Neokomagataea]QDH23993.1 NAD(P)H-hydrate dehydratase [Neokomagataea tanensis]
MTLHPLVLLSPHDSQSIDSAFGEDGHVRAVEGAGWAVARAIRARYAPCKTVVVCGPGFNGADGYVAARWLEVWGWSVVVLAVAAPKKDSLVEVIARSWRGRTFSEDGGRIANADLVVDAVFGAGLSRPLSDGLSHILRQANRLVAIDVPSGVCGETGRLLGSVKKAELTISFIRPRPAHFLEPAKALCGEIVCADIGLPADAVNEVKPRVFLNEPGLWLLPVADRGDHKYSRGVVSICGADKMTGAVRIAAQAARSSGAGLVRILGGDVALYRHSEPGLIVDDVPIGEAVKDSRRQVWLCGPGLSNAEVEAYLPQLISAGKTILADAGALGTGAEAVEALRGVSVITPHMGEFRRLFGALAESPRIEAARQAAQCVGAVVVLKGSDTIIAAPDGRVAINQHASPALATAGSGDTLAGIVSALLAGGMPAWEASCAAVWLHGDAGIAAASEYGGWPVVEALEKGLGRARQRAEKHQNAKNYKNLPFARL